MMELLIDDNGAVSRMNKALSESLAPLVPKVEVPGSVWADKNFYLCRESSGIAGPWKCRPYQIFLIDVMADKWIEEVNFLKSRRVGGSKTALAAVMSMIEQRQTNVRIYRPVERLALSYVIKEIDPAIRDIKVIGEKLLCDPKKKSKYNTSEIKAFVGCVLDIVSGSTATNYRDAHCDVVLLDEAAAFPSDVNGEGNPFKLSDGRTDGATHPKKIRLSTPVDESNTLLDEAVENSDEIFFRYIKCPDCGGHHVLKWNDFSIEDSMFRCPVTGSMYGYEKFYKADAGGYWANEDGTVKYSDSEHIFTDAEGNRVKTPRRIGVRIWGAYSYQKTWKYISEEWNIAMDYHKKGNSAYLKTFVNTIKGETYKEESQALNHEKLYKLRVPEADWRETISNEVLLITAGADIQGGGGARIELEIVGWGTRGRSWSLDYVIIPGDPFEEDVWRHLDDHLSRYFTREDGVRLYIRGAMIDAGWPTSVVYDYTRPREEANVYAIMGVEKGTVPNRPVRRGEFKTTLYTSSTTEAKGTIIKNLKATGDKHGRCYFPENRSDEYFKQLANIKKVKRYNKYKTFVGYGYDKNSDIVRDEAVDCRHYAMAAKGKLNVHMPTLEERLNVEREQLDLVKK